MVSEYVDGDDGVTNISMCHLQEWQDVNLVWNSSEYGGIQSLRLPAEIIWKPDLLMYNRSL